MLPRPGAFGSFAASGLPLPDHVPQFREMGIWGWLLVDLAINWIGWAVAAALKTEVFYDALGSVSFATLAIGSLLSGPIGGQKVLVTAMVLLWTARLGTYLVSRIIKTGHDSRFDQVKSEPGTFFVYWTLQAVWVFVSISPLLVVNLSPVALPIKPLAAAGAVLFAAGLIFESVADWQKSVFKADPANKGNFIDVGLWSISRHPNYFGEMVVWWGVFAASAVTFTQPLQFLTVMSPITVFCVLRYLSGIPIQERQADQRWATSPEYQQYKAATPMLMPIPPMFKDSHKH